jgi:hypothetical protein
MSNAWIGLLNFFSSLEFRIADKVGEVAANLFHFSLFWILPVVLIFIPSKVCALAGLGLAFFYVFILVGDIFFSVFGHEKLEKKRGMLDIVNVQEMRQEIIGALIKFLGAVLSFATIFNGLQMLSHGRAFIIPNPSPFPYFDLFFFSVVTIATIGYGDIQPALWTARGAAILEIAFGMGFILLLFTMMVSVYIDIQKRKE